MKAGVPIEDIPQAILDEVGIRLQDYFVPLSALSLCAATPRFRFIGSGTLVEIAGGHYILTAAHVWHEASNDEQLGVALTAYPAAFSMPRDAIVAHTIWSRSSPEWGPDLALLRIPKPFVARIQAHKSFLNLSQHKAALAQHPPELDSLWAVTGMIDEFSGVQRHPELSTIDACLHGRALFSGIHHTHQRGDYDYLDTTAKLALDGVPSTFGGVSGGGLWEIGLSMKKQVISWDGSRRFCGVAFWQSAIDDGRRVIRCHGPRSIFEAAWNSWAQPHAR